MGPYAIIFVSWMSSFKSAFSVSSFTTIKRHFSSSSLSAVRVVSSAYLRLLILLLAVLFPALIHAVWHFASCTLHISYISVNIQPWCTLSQFWTNLFFHVPFQLLLLDLHKGFLRRQVRWSDIPISLRIFHSLFWSTQSNTLAYSTKQKYVFL